LNRSAYTYHSYYWRLRPWRRRLHLVVVVGDDVDVDDVGGDDVQQQLVVVVSPTIVRPRMYILSWSMGDE